MIGSRRSGQCEERNMPIYNNQSDDIFCNLSIKYDLLPALIIYISSGTLCGIVCVIVVVLMTFFRMFKLLTHRLILYMLVSALFYCVAVIVTISGLWQNYWKGEYDKWCEVEGFFIEYSLWVMFLSILIVTLHLANLVLFDKCYESIAKLEPFYFFFPWIFPAVVAWIPFVHHNYGLSGPWCWIRLYNNDCSLNEEGLIEVYVLWYGDFILGLILNNIGLTIVSILLCKRACQNTTSMNYRKALKQASPLIAYPIVRQFLSAFSITNRIYTGITGGHFTRWMYFTQAALSPSWGLFAGLFTLGYLVMLKKFSKESIKRTLKEWRGKKKNIYKDSVATKHLIDPEDHLTMYGTTVVSTTFPIPSESVIDEDM